MYSVVLMMAMTGGADVPAGHFGHGSCYGGCYGSYSYGCCGGYGNSCHGGYSYGCCGGYGNSCHGGYSYGCCGGYSYGCCGGGSRHHGRRHHGGHGCCGGYSYGSSCYGSSCYGSSCYGSSYGSCSGNWDCNCGTVMSSGCYGGTVVPTAPAAPAEKLDQKPVEQKKETRSAAPVTIIVSLPTDATLTIDDAVTSSKSSRRVFVSPALPIGREFSYTLKATFTKDGKPVVVSKDVVVHAGEEVAVKMDASLTGVASR